MASSTGRRSAQFAARCMREFDVRAGGPDAPARSLSGGNLQKFIVGREMSEQPAVMVLAQPTWGVDVAATALIRQRILDLAAQGVAVLVVSEDLGEILEVCDRVAVMARRAPFAGARRRRDERRRDRRVDGRRLRAMIRLVRRPAPSRAMLWTSPIIAVAATFALGAALFSALGQPAGAALHALFIAPVTDLNGVSELLLKASPLCLIALGLAIGFRSNVWNIGAEGQMYIGAVLRDRPRDPFPERLGRLDASGDDRGRRRRGHAVGRDRRGAARASARERDPGEPDAHLRGGVDREVPGVRSLAGPGRQQLPAHGVVRGQRAVLASASLRRIPGRNPGQHLALVHA